MSDLELMRVCVFICFGMILGYLLSSLITCLDYTNYKKKIELEKMKDELKSRLKKDL